MAYMDSSRHTPRASRKDMARERHRDQKRRLTRRSLLETLENRHLMAVGPTLVGIEPNNGTLLNLTGATTLTQSPTELILRFADTQRLDENSLNAIRITRAGEDGFATSRAATDFNTNGLAVVEFIGAGSSETRIQITATDRGAVSAVPGVTVSGNTINIGLNNNPAAPTRVSDLLTAINTGPAANLVTVNLLQGVNFAPISSNVGSSAGVSTLAATAAANSTSLTLQSTASFAIGQPVQVALDNGLVHTTTVSAISGTALSIASPLPSTASIGRQVSGTGINFTLVAADRAQVTSNLSASNVRVRFAARATGEAGQGISISVLNDPSVGTAPNISVVGKAITVRINPTANVTVKQLVDALIARPAVDELLEIRFEAGNPNALVGNPGLFSPILLQGGQAQGAGQAENVIIPGFVGMGDLPGEVIVRFAEPLPQDTYRIEISAEGDDALTNVLGQPLNQGQDFSATFELNLAPKVQAVVPQPIVSDSLGRRQLLNEVWVYFDRNDPLNKQNLEANPSLFRLYSITNPAVAPLVPIVSYDVTSGVARLRFSQDLQPNASAANTWRLRVGADPLEATVPVNVVLPNENDPATPINSIAGDSFASAFDVSTSWSPSTSRISSVVLSGEIRNGTANGLRLDFPGGSDEPGNRQIRAEDPTRLLGPVPLDHLRSGADSVDGVTVFQYNFSERFNNFRNLITQTQKVRVREVLELYSQYLGVQFVETPNLGIQIAVGDLAGAGAVSGLGGLAVAAGGSDLDNDPTTPANPLAVLDFRDFEQSDDDQIGDEFFRGAMFAVGQALGYGYADELPLAINSGASIFTTETEALFPGPADIIHGQHLYRPDSIDIDLYRFSVPSGGGKITVETFAERLNDTSLLDTHLRLFRQLPGGGYEEIAANDDLWSSDSQIELTLSAGTYFVGVSASGNSVYNPGTSGTGFGGRSEGAYELRMSFTPTQQVAITDVTGIALDGDGDGVAGGHYDFWFDTAVAARTVYVDKRAPAGGTGAITSPLNTIAAAVSRANLGNVDVIRIMANGGADGRLETTGDNVPYLLGFNENGQQLADGAELQVPRGVTVMVDAGAVIKLRRARIGVGSISPALADMSGGALQLLGTPLLVTAEGSRLAGDIASGEVVLTALADRTVAGSQSVNSARAGDWGGVDFRSDIDKSIPSRQNLEAQGIFLNAVQWADIRYGGGVVLVGGRPTVISPVEMSHARPLVAYSTIALSADSAMEATPNSFEETKYFLAGRERQAAGDFQRVGPDLRGNRFVNEDLAQALGTEPSETINTLNGVFVRTETLDGTGLERLTMQARFNDRDIVHVLGENLSLLGAPGGPIMENGVMRARLDARLMIDPGLVVKNAGTLIELGIGTQLIAEGTPGRSIIMTSLDDRRYGGGGTFNTTAAGPDQGFEPADRAADWGGIYVGLGASASLDHVRLVGAGGTSRIEGLLAGFNPIEVRQGDLRLTNSRIEDAGNAGDGLGGDRIGRGTNSAAAIYVRGAQPVVANNVFIGNDGPALNFDVNSLNNAYVVDKGRSTGAFGRVVDAVDNQGPLIRGNVLQNNSINGMLIRGGVLATEGVWDDTDMVHVVLQSIEVPNQHVFGGLRLESSPTQSLVVKFQNTSDENGVLGAAGIVAGGTLNSASAQFQDIDDRIGGSLQVIGQSGKPVVLTSLADDSIGAGFDLLGRVIADTGNDGFGGTTLLPTGPEVFNGLLIDNDVNVNTVGYFGVEPDTGGQLGFLGRGGVTVEGLTQTLINQNFIFAFTNFVDVGSNGGAVNLANTVITLPATLIDNDVVISEGNFPGQNGIVNWRVETRLDDGVSRVINTVSFNSEEALGDIRFINYLDEDVLGVADDLLFTTGIPGQDNFRVFTLDGAERIGFAQSGAFVQGPLLQNASYQGWAANQFNLLQAGIIGAGVPFTIPGNINLANLPAFNDPGLGLVNGPADITTAFAWNVNPTATTSLVTTYLELVPQDPSGIPSGDWQGITIREGASDNNYRMVVEAEGGGVGTGTFNDNVNFAQYVGELAPSEKFATENRAKGFRISGSLSTPTDVDHYSFKAEAGTEVWLDIDQSYSALDAVLELVDVGGTMLVRSESSILEATNGPTVGTGFDSTRANGFADNTNSSNRSAFAQHQDLYSTNPNDPGFRVVLPGSPGQVNTYRVRVSSKNQLTRGAYQFEIRVTELDQSPGTYLSLADIRFARRGIDVIGQPLHSPLLGEEAETTLPNDTLAQAQRVGMFGVNADGTVTTLDAGPLSSDRLSKSIAGNLSGPTDVDWYQFQIAYNNLTADGVRRYLATVFDVDYADGFARPDISIWVFDAAGNLVLSGLDSNIAEDQPVQTRIPNLSDLSAGSLGSASSEGNLDPFIGSVELTEGTYFLAVGGRDFVPAEFNQFYVPNPANPLFRLEPIESIQRIVEDRIGGPTTATVPPKQSLLFNPSTMETPFTLNDMALYVNQGDGIINIVNPFSGQNYGSVGSAVGAGAFLRDISFRGNGNLHGYYWVPAQGDDGLQYIQIDTGTAAVTNLTPAGTNLVTRQDIVAEQGVQVLDANSDDGFFVEAITFGNVNGAERGYIVGNRAPRAGLQYNTNVLFEFDENNGNIVTGAGGAVGVNLPLAIAGAGMLPREIGTIETVPPVAQRTRNILGVSDATGISPDGQQIPLFQNNDSFNVLDAVGNILGTFVFSSGPEVRFSSLLVDSGFTRGAGGFNVQLATGSSPTDNFYNGLFLQVGGEIREIVDYDANSQTVALETPFSFVPPPGSAYRILSENFVRDGDVLTVTPTGAPAVRFEFDTGPRLRIDVGIRDGSQVTLTGLAGQTATFEFDNNFVLANPNNIAVPLNTNATLSASLAAQINGAAIGVTADAIGNEIVLSRLTTTPTVTTGISVVGSNGVATGNIPIVVEESMGASEIATLVVRALRENGIESHGSGARINIPFAASAVGTGTGFTTIAAPASLTPIRFNVDDQETTIRDSIIAAINASPLGIAANPFDADSLIIPANFAVVRGSGLIVGGTAPTTGLNVIPSITGVATIANTLYAVSNAGGLFRVTATELQNFGNNILAAATHYVATATDLVGINFTGLSQGPSGYGDLLFGIDNQGVLYAFDTAGDLQPIFAGGRSSIATGVVGATGLDFSTLQTNLWGVASDGRPGHGSNPTFNGSRAGTAGGEALRFGPYNFPGGAHGEITSQPFSLVGYSAADQPMLYFTYFLETENTGRPADVLRVYVVADDGTESLVSSNFEGEVGRENEAFDNSDSWRQARVPMGDFAGMDNLRFRVEFSTAGNMSFWNSSLTAVPATEIEDGDQFSVSGRTFEFDKSLTITLPLDTATLATGQLLQQNAPGGHVVRVDGVDYALVVRDQPRTVVADYYVEYLPLMNGPTIARLLADAIAASVQNVSAADLPLTFNDTTQRTNDTLATATVLPLIGEQTVIDLPELNIGAPGNAAALDVDLYRLDVVQGHTITAIIEAESLGFVPVVRLFDAAGAPLPFVLDNLGAGIVRLIYSATATGDIYLGVSGGTGPNPVAIPGNSAYDPLDATTAAPGTVGVYRLNIVADRNSNVRSADNEIAINRDATASVSAGTAVTLTGDDGASGIPVPYNVAMTATEVAAAVSEALRSVFVRSTRIPPQILGASGANVNLQGVILTNPGPLLQRSSSGNANGVGVIEGARNNAGFEGVWLDDFIIGVAERGEIGSGGAGLTGFQASGNPTAGTSPTEGSYQIEVRDGSEYLYAASYPLANALPFPTGRGFDTNERQGTGTTLVVASGRLIDQLVGAMNVPLTFTVSDGENQVTFQFVNLDILPPGKTEADAPEFVQGTNVPVPYSGGWTASEVAARVLQAMQSTRVTSALDVRALMANGSTLESVVGGDLSAHANNIFNGEARINLFGAKVAVTSDITGFVTSVGELLTVAQRQLISAQQIPDPDGGPLISLAQIVDFLNGTVAAAPLNLPGFALAVQAPTGRGDANRARNSQGVVMIDGVNVQRSSEFGVRLDHGLGTATNPNIVRYPRNLIELNTQNLVPGVVVQNSIFAFNRQGGIEVVGVGADPSSAPPLPFDRLVNNTIVGGEVTEGPEGAPVLLDGTLFPLGNISFADAVVAYTPSVGSNPVPPSIEFRTPNAALGAPNYTVQGEPTLAGQGAVSLGRRGSLVVQFVNNRLTGSGDAAPDLKVFEVGLTEPVRVEVSIDGVNYTDVGIVQGGQNTVDIDRYGFGPADRISYVRVTDVGFSVVGDIASGADIDAIGAITTVPADVFTVGGTGISLTERVSPTVINNVLVNNSIGIQSDAASVSAVVSANTYQRNTVNAAGAVRNETLSQLVGPLEDIFVSMTSERFIPARNSSIIDNGITSLQDRAQLVVVKSPLGLPQSPVLAPELDGNGTRRVDDPTIDIPGGVGQLLFIDRGALDRGDNAPPRAIVASPLDQGTDDRNRALDQITVIAQSTRFFDIRLADGGEPIDPNGGVGIDDSSVNANAILLTKNGIPQILDTDYRFSYDANTDTIRLVPTAGLWEIDSLYEISLVTDNQAVLIARDPNTYVDGDRFQVIDQNDVTTTFEFDTGVIVRLLDDGNGRAGVIDGTQVTIFDGTNQLTFEYELSSGTLPGVGFGNIPVSLVLNATLAEAAQSLAAAISASTLNVTVVDLQDGRVQLLSANRNMTATTISPQLAITGTAGVEPGYGILIPSLLGVADGIFDGQQFSIRRGDGREVLFEFTIDANVTGVNAVPVLITLNAPVLNVAQAINAAIRSTNLDLLPLVDPTGIVLLPDAADASLILGSSNLQQIGRSGQTASIRIPLPLNLSVLEVSTLLEQVIDLQNLPGVSTEQIGDRVIVSGTVSGTGSALVAPPSDLAGNRLAGNADSGFAVFQIQLTTTSGIDFGDAPGSEKANGGPSHQIVDAFSLGPVVNSEADALIATGDSSDDGITITNELGTQVQNGGFVFAGFSIDVAANVVNGVAGRSAFIDAWIDWNGDGVFDTTGLERIATRVSVQPGLNSLGNISVPASAARTTVHARFRLSTTGNLGPGGHAVDGEVEDYSFTISSNPFQNGANIYDVNRDGNVTPIDALLVINALENTPAPHVPLPGGTGFSLVVNSSTSTTGPFWDINGDGLVTPMDALAVINRLNAITNTPSSEPEGLLPAAPGVLAPASQVVRDSYVPNVDRTLADAGLGEAIVQLANEGTTSLTVATDKVPTLFVPTSDSDDDAEETIWDTFFTDLG